MQRLPTELKRQRGTLNVTREKRERMADTAIRTTPMIIQGTSVACPQTITDKYCKAYWKKLTKGLLSIGVLSAADIPQVEQLVLTLQKLREVQAQFVDMSPYAEGFDDVEKRYGRLVDRFDRLGAKYYISPQSRSKIRLDDLNIREKELTVAEKEQTAIGSLLAARKGSD